MKKRIKMLLMGLTVVTLIFTMSVSAFAAEEDTEDGGAFAPPSDWAEGETVTVLPDCTETPLPDNLTEGVDIEKIPELPDKSDGAFSVEGNGEVLDDIYDGNSGKEFYIITTANNNTFYLIIDHASSTQNVYMLSMIDENDLKDFITEEDVESPAGTDTETKPSVDLGEDNAGDGAPDEKEPDKENKSGNTVGTVLIILVIGAAAGGLCFYFKIYKPKKEAKISDEDMEYIDEDNAVNEDEAEEDQITADTDIGDLDFYEDDEE